MKALSDRKKRSSMERVFRVRLTNMRHLSRAYRHKTDLARVLGVDPSFLTHIMGENPIRTIGEKLARDIEVKLGLHSGWLDIVR